MSALWTNLAWYWELHPHARYVLLALAHLANENGTVTIKRADLSRLAGVSLTAISVHIRTLKSAGAIRVDIESGRGSDGNAYHLVHPAEPDFEVEP